MIDDRLAIALLLLLAYSYLGYPLLLRLLARLFPKPHRCERDYCPSVTLVVSAYNEAAVIEEKLVNSLELDYPKEKLAILVVSDCSDDGTDQAVARYACSGIRLLRAPERRGKTAALNLALAQVESEVVVFSDANALYQPDAIRKLVGHFADRTIGYVVGYARYREETRSAAGGTESLYWDLETRIKLWESEFSSVVGGDGAIYAIRRPLYEPLLETDINDFVNPLQIVVKGYRGVFEPGAVCFEKPAGSFEKEYARKIRIVNRSFNGVLRVRQALNPLRVGFFSWQLLSHKLLRWFSPYLAALLLALLLQQALAGRSNPVTAVTLCFAALLLLAAGLGWLLRGHAQGGKLWFVPCYFVLMNLACALGIYHRLRGRTISTWSTVRVEAPAGLRRPWEGE
ncbi:MAG TPA: glycosyltransferase family 2 protein [Geomonas sp.]|nr:glycosyltransferase family 2 protein [Geomonas sp.]